MSKKCNDTNIPEVDETQLECCEIVSTKCVSLEKSVPKLALPIGSTLTKFIERITAFYSTLKTTVDNIEHTIDSDTLTEEIEVTSAQLSEIEQGNESISLITAPSGKVLIPIEIYVTKTGNLNQNLTSFCDDFTVYNTSLVPFFYTTSSPNRVYGLSLSFVGVGFQSRTDFQSVNGLSLTFQSIFNPGTLDAGNLNLKFKIKYKLFDVV